ncbi:hypothetical protein [Planctomicrobium piriforme]|uniref:Uncharacterized protein n=1 Tax=Planctomicrobium piriforme TaxID=1576369 RepID=A0A1I3E3W5_9PLAN|nr:hypothetical protein [Planctomicrobium piriforme]SFH93538.1 hypothetical protein SAMN05421753_10465 [Planctomicrobium piriforme]
MQTLHDHSAPKSLECIEIYVPKKLEHLSELYNFLRAKVTRRKEDKASGVTIDGFSLYEVDGAFFGERMYEERTLVIRILFLRSPDDDADSIHRKIMALGTEIGTTVALTEEELWICHYQQGVVIFRSQANQKRA